MKNEIWSQFEPGYYEESNWGQELWQNLKLRSVKSLIPDKAKKILDIGCGDGYFVNKLSVFFHNSAKIYGIDISDKLIKAAKIKYPHLNFTCADSDKLPFINNEFDLIFCTEVLEHLVNPEKSLSEAGRVLKKDGKMIIELDSGTFLFRLIFGLWVKFGRGRIWRGAHLQQFNPERLEKLFKKSGFRIEKKIVSHFGMAVTYLLKK